MRKQYGNPDSHPFFLWKKCRMANKTIENVLYIVLCKSPRFTYLCGYRLHSQPLFRSIIRNCTCVRYFSKFASVIAYYLVFFVFYINNVGNWNTFIASENLLGKIDNFGAVWDSIESFVMIRCPTSFLTTKGRSQRVQQSSRGEMLIYFYND